jgi:hypothetical protein
MKGFSNCFSLCLTISAVCTAPNPSADVPHAPKAALKPGVVTVAPQFAADTLVFPEVFEAAFSKGTVVRQDSIAYNFTVRELGKLLITSGKLVAGDPVVLVDRPAFTRHFPLGRFPVQVAVATRRDDERVSFARVRFSNARVSKWQLALLPGQKAIALTDKSLYCYGVDAGMGAFIDSVANRQLALQGQTAWDKAFVQPFEQPDCQGAVYNFGGHTLATFRTGYGDGCYATFIGLDAHGQVCRFVTDFGLVVW